MERYINKRSISKEDQLSGEYVNSLPGWFSPEKSVKGVVYSTRIRLSRNIADYPFPVKCSVNEKNEILSKVFSCSDDFIPDSFHRDYSVISDVEKELFYEDRIATHDLITGSGSRGLIHDKDGTLSLLINEEDHLRIQYLNPGIDIWEPWERVDSLDNRLMEYFRYSYSQRHGFLTSCPSNAGTGIKVSFLMFLPGLVLTKEAEKALTAASRMGMAVRGFFGENSKATGYFFQVSSSTSLGRDEESILKEGERVVRKLVDLELTARERVLKEAHYEIEDKLSRSVGILRNAKLMDVNEMINLTSNLRVGIHMGLYDDMEEERLNRIVHTLFPAHMRIILCDEFEGSEEGACRAEILRKCF